MLESRVAISLIFILILSSITSIISDNATTEEMTTIAYQNSTDSDKPSGTPVPLWAAFLGCIIASLFFGSNLLPVKQFSAGDGFFFQFVFCVAVWFIGLLLDLILNNQRFYPLVLLGGVLWTTGNLVTVFCIKTCGLAVCLLILGTTSLIMGWAGGRFGIFDIEPHIPKTTIKLALNYASVILAAVSAIFFLFIKSATKPRGTRYVPQDNGAQEIELVEMRNISVDNVEGTEIDFPFLNRLSDKVQKIVGCGLSALAGIFYGVMFIPDQYIRDHKENICIMENTHLIIPTEKNYYKTPFER